MAINDPMTYDHVLMATAETIPLYFPINDGPTIAAVAQAYAVAFDTALAAGAGAGTKANRGLMARGVMALSIKLVVQGRIAGTPPGNPHTPAGYQSTIVSIAVSSYTSFIPLIQL
jgi:hypothetical protein